MAKRVCKVCGKEFESKIATSYCSDCKVGICAVCGKTFNKTWESRHRKWCSPDCKIKYAKQNGGLQKIYTYQSRTCAWCGEEFVPDTPHQKYCNRDHYNLCPVCESPVLIKAFHDPVKCCSDECVKKLRARTNLERCGYENAGAAPDNIEKAAQTNLLKYGDRIYARTRQYKEANESWCLSFCGYTSLFSSPEIRERNRQTLFERTGYYEPLQLPHVREANLKCMLDPEVQRSSALKRADTRAKIQSYDGKHFDSKYELDVYEFFSRIGLSIETQIVKPLNNSSGKHNIIYDFLVDGQLYECKGGHLLEGCWSGSQVTIEDKINSYIENNVILITDTTLGFSVLETRFDPNIQAIDIEIFRIYNTHGDVIHDHYRSCFQDESDVWCKVKQLLINGHRLVRLEDLAIDSI